MNKNQFIQDNIKIGTHGEDYGNWMSTPMFYIVGETGVLFSVLSVLCFWIWHYNGIVI